MIKHHNMKSEKERNAYPLMHRITALLSAFALLLSSLAIPVQAEKEAAELICKLEEHRHTAECYPLVLTCGKEESAPVTETHKEFVKNFKTHKHTSECFNQDGDPVCGYAEGVYYHKHNEYCYDENGELVCGLRNASAHKHTDSCYETEKVLICGQKESEEHKHTEACYEEKKTLTCKQAAYGNHKHSKDCFDARGHATCGKVEVPVFECSEDNWKTTTEVISEGHTHTDACYSRASEANCGKQEHVHSAACYREPEEEQPAEEQPVDEQSADEEPTEEEFVDEQPTEEEPAEDKTVDEQPADEEPAEEQPVDEQPAEEEPAENEHVDEQPAVEEPEEEEPVDEQPAEEEPAEEKPVDEQPAEEKPVVEQPAEEQAAEETPVDEDPAEEEPAEKPEEETTETEEVLITKTLRIGEAWSGRVSRTKPAVLKLEAGQNQRVHMLLEGKGVWAAVVRSDHPDEDPARNQTDSETNRTIVTWNAEAGAYLIYIGPAEYNLISNASATFMDDAAFEIWQAEHEETETESNTEEENRPESDPDTDKTEQENTSENPEQEPADPEESGEEIADSGEEPEEEADIPGDDAEEDPEASDEAEEEVPITEEDEISEENEPDSESEDGEVEDGETEEEEPADEEIEEELLQESPLIHTGADYTVTAAFGPEAAFPQGTELRVREILPGTAEYNLYSGRTDEILNENWNETADFARFFDITFVYEEQEIEPQAPVDVQITFAEAIPVAEENDVQTIHFADNGATLISSDTQSVDAAVYDETAVDTVAFSSDSFSVYGFVQTVQMTENVIAADGQAYRVEVTYGRESDIPVNAALAVREILPDDSRYDIYLNEALRAAGYDISEENSKAESAERYARFFDIVILANDEKTEPQSNVSVNISLADLPSSEESKLKVVHFAEDETVVVDAEIASSADIQFDTDSFSIYGVIAIPSDDPEVEDLNGMTFIVSKDGRYMTANPTPVGNATRFAISTNADDAQVWQFEATGEPGMYNIFTVDSDTGEKQYLQMNRHDSSNANLSLNDTPQAFTVTKNQNGTYTISAQSRGVTYYLGIVGNNNPLFSGHVNDADNQINLTFTQPVMQAGKQYIMLTEYEGEYYVIKNDGTLVKANDPVLQEVGLSDPMVWQYTGSNVYHRTTETGFNGNNLASDYFYRYIDPDSSTGLTDEDYNTTTGHLTGNGTEYIVDSRPLMDQIKIDYHNNLVSSQNNPNHYIGVVETKDGLKIAGKQTAANAAPVYFVEMNSADSLIFGNNADENNAHHTVNHIDISIVGHAVFRIPLAYGTYYYKDQNGNIQRLIVNKDNPVSVDVAQDVDIDREDVKRASIDAYTIDKTTGEHIPMDDAFYITGFSGNGENGTSSNQTRIEGVFKVADVHTLDSNHYNANDWNQDDRSRPSDAILQERLNNRIYYTVSTTKQVTCDLLYNGFGLYRTEEEAQEGDPDKVHQGTITVKLSESFDYWRPENECPPLMWDGGYYWRQGGIIYGGDERSGSGLDFALGTHDDDPTGIRAIEITKFFVDMAGNPIVPAEETDNVFHIMHSETAPYDAVRGMDVEEYAGGQAGYNYDSNGYHRVLDRTITISEGGIGTIYDYSLDEGMIYIEEDTSEKNLPRVLEDADGRTWAYKNTYFETEYVWRDDGIEYKRHVSKVFTLDDGTYRSIPDVLGDYKDINGIDRYNGFLEFYVYNIYEAEPIDVPVKKTWKHENGSNAESPDGASITVELGRYKLVEDAGHPVTGTLVINHNVNGYQANNDNHHYTASYKLKQGNRVVRTGTYDRANPVLTMEKLASGIYTLEVTESLAGYTYTSPTKIDGEEATSKNITVNVGQTTTVAVETHISSQKPIKLINVRVTNELESNPGNLYQDKTYSFPAGSTIVFTIYRPSRPLSNAGFRAWVNGDDFPLPTEGNDYEYTYVDQRWEVTLPTNGNGTSYNFIHTWGTENFWIKSVVLKSDLSTGTQSSMAVSKRSASIEAARADDSTQIVVMGGGVPPESDIPGMMYVDDENWPTAEEGQVNVVTLSDGLWEGIVRDLPVEDEYGYKYQYYIRKITEQGVLSGTEVIIDTANDGSVLTSSGETTLGVTNTIPNEKPKITLAKTDDNGVPLKGAKFNFSLYQSWSTEIEIDSPDGLYISDELEDGTYTIGEIAAPKGYVEMSGAIIFSVVNRTVSILTIPDGVTFDTKSYTFTIKNEPINEGELKILKRWLDIYGNESTSGGIGDQTFTLIQMARDQQSQRVVKVEFYYQNNGTWNLLKSMVRSGRGTATVTWHWNRDTHIGAENITVIGNGMVNSTGSDEFMLTIPYTGNGNETVTVRIDNYNYNPIDGSGYIGDVAWPQANELGDGYTATGGTKTVTLRNPVWVEELRFGGSGKLEQSSVTLPSTYEGRPCVYMIEEEPVPEGYTVSYSANNAIGIGAGEQATITAYNRKNSADVKLIKVDSTDRETKLAGAEFTIIRLDPNQNGAVPMSGWNREPVTTGADGVAEFTRLPMGYYEIRETGTPENYTVEEGQESIYIKVSADGITSLIKDETRQPARWSTRPNSSRVTVNRDKSLTIGNEINYGAMKITKAVMINEAVPTEENAVLTDGTYVFTIEGVEGTFTEGESHTVSITFENGLATGWEIDGEAHEAEGTNHEWSVVIPGLKPGQYTVKETETGTMSLLSATGGESVSEDKTVMAVVMPGDATPETANAQITFTNNRDIASLKVSKTVQNDTTVDVSDQSFTFTVTLTAPEGTDIDGEYPTVATTGDAVSEGTATITSGEWFTITLKDGESWQIDQLPVGTLYSVEESALPVGWTLITDNPTEGTLSTAGAVEEIPFTNVYSEITGAPEGIKQLTGREWTEGDSFSFVLAADTEDETTTAAVTAGTVVLPATTTATVSDGTDNPDEDESVNGTANQTDCRNFIFDAITFKDAGTYTFTITEDLTGTTDGVKDGVVYAKEPVKVTYVIGKTAGVLSLDSVTYTPENKTLVNTYVSTTFVPKAKKTLLNGTITENQFTFILTETADDTATTGEQLGTVQVSNTEAVSFEEITWNLSQLTDTDEQERKTKTFHYIITEDIPEGASEENNYIINGIRYDNTIHRLAVTVTDNGDGTLSKQILLDGIPVSDAEAIAEFVNEKPMTLNIVKVDKEHTEELLKGAEFVLEKYTAPETPEGAYSWVQTGDAQTTEANGEITFTNLLHGYYRIKETKAPNGYMYTGSGMFHIRIDGNGMTLLEKGDGIDPTLWPEAANGKTGDVLTFETGDNLTKTATVGNKIGTVLPSTGGAGTGSYTLTGLTMILAAGILILIRRRRERARRE